MSSFLIHNWLLERQIDSHKALNTPICQLIAITKNQQQQQQK
jgi:hypothetical protein